MIPYRRRLPGACFALTPMSGPPMFRVVIARDLVLTAARCVLPGDYSAPLAGNHENLTGIDAVWIPDLVMVRIVNDGIA